MSPRSLGLAAAIMLASLAGGCNESQPDAATGATKPALPKGVLAEIHVAEGGAPTGMVFGDGSGWVATHRGSTLYRIDPGSNRITASIELPAEACGTPAFVTGRVLTSVCVGQTGFNMIIDPATNKILGKGDCGGSVAAGGGSVWSGAEMWMTRCDKRTFRNGVTVRAAGPHVSSVAYGFGSVWAGDGIAGVVRRIDPRTGTVTATIAGAHIADPENSDTHLTVAFGTLWETTDDVSSSNQATIYRISPRSGSATAFKVAVQPMEFYSRPVVAGLGSLWLRRSDSTVVRLDPANLRAIGTYPADPASGGGGDMAVAYGSLWVSNPDTDTIWRDRVTS